MNLRSPELLDRLASEYVLGTMRGPARQRFERLYQLDEASARIVHRWEDRFLAIALGVRPVRPSARVWTAILRRVVDADRSKDRRSVIRPWHLAMAAGLAAVAVAVGWYKFGSHGLGSESRTESVAQFAMADGSQIWRVELSEHATTLRIATVGPVEAQPGHAYELWALPKGGAPVSLGLMPTTGSAKESLSGAQRVALLASRKLAISLEPPGGSPTGAPTGPVVHMADWVART
jgi:anti-sigma-K factor RskA